MKTTLTILAAITTASAAPKDQDKLQTRLIGQGQTKLVEITGSAGTDPLTVRWGSGKNDFMTVPANQRKTVRKPLGTSYKVTATENGAIVDTETATRKTGLAQDRSLR